MGSVYDVLNLCILQVLHLCLILFSQCHQVVFEYQLILLETNQNEYPQLMLSQVIQHDSLILIDNDSLIAQVCPNNEIESECIKLIMSNINTPYNDNHILINIHVINLSQ